MQTQKQNGNIIAIVMMVFLFAMISFVTNLAAPMGVVLTNQFAISNAEGMLGNMANFIAYLFMGIPAGLLLQKLGYKKTALIAVAVGFIGLAIQFLSGHAASFTVYLLGAFVCGFSVCMLNTVVNPMLNTLGGGGNKGNQLIQIAGAFNSLAGASVPMIVGMLVGNVMKAQIADVFPLMYIAMGIFAVIFIVLSMVHIPEPHLVNKDKAAKKEKSKHSPWNFRHFVLGAVAIFIYVGVEVGIPATANLYMAAYTTEQAEVIKAEYAKQQADEVYLNQLKAEDEANIDNKHYVNKVLSEKNNEVAINILEGKTSPGLGVAAGVAGSIVAIYWILMLCGRLLGGVIGGKVSSKQMLLVASSAAAIFIVAAILIPSTVAVNVAGIIGSPVAVNVPISIVFIILCGLCTSVMWGGIFNLAVEGLGKYVAAASGIFMMMVCGGGIMPFLQSMIADGAGYMISYWLVFAGFIYMLYYALIGSKNVNKDIPVE